MNKRNTGLDLLRLLAMFMIVLIHVNMFGGLLENNFFSIKFIPIYLFESLGRVSVNCFVLISGFFLVKQDFRSKKLLSLIIEIIFYSWLIFIVVNLIKIPVDKKMIIKSLFPISSGCQWFVTCYIMLYILFPFINKFIYSLTLKQKHIFAILITLLFCIWTFIPTINKQSTFSGYSILWVLILYYWGGYIRIVFVEGENKNLFEKISKFSGYGYIVFCLINLILMNILNLIGEKVFIIINYNSLFVFLAAICLFIFMYKINIKNNFITKFIVFFAPASFGIFLISTNIFFKKYQKIILDKDFFLQSFNMPIMVLICAVSIFVVCLLISKFFHQKIFNFSDKYIYPTVEKISLKLENNFKNIWKK